MERDQLNVRLDPFYQELVQLMIKKEKQEGEKSNKTKLTKSALMYYANYLLSDDEITNLKMKYIGKI